MKKILFLMTAVLVIAGCSKSEDGKLTLSANQVSLYSGDTKQVTVNDNATWSSKSEFVAEVSEDGIIKGNHVGKTIITATSDNEEIAKFLSERYQVIGKDSDGAYYFINNDSDKYNMGVRLSVESGFIMVVYVPQSPKSRSIQAADLQELKSILGI